MKTQTEEWRPIKGYENYMVSSKGKVKSLNYNKTGKEKILKPANDGHGYLFVQLCKNGKVKKMKVHRLVANAFIPNPNNYPIINHRDETRCNNCVENLEWCTVAYNNSYGTRTEKCSTSIKCFDLQTNQEIIFPSINEAGRQLKIRQTTIWSSIYICNSPYKKRYIFTEV